MSKPIPFRPKAASQGGSGCRRSTAQERANDLTHAPIPTHMAAGTPRNAPAADWSEPVVMLFWLGAFVLGFAMACGV